MAAGPLAAGSALALVVSAPHRRAPIIRLRLRLRHGTVLRRPRRWTPKCPAMTWTCLAVGLAPPAMRAPDVPIVGHAAARGDR